MRRIGMNMSGSLEDVEALIREILEALESGEAVYIAQSPEPTVQGNDTLH